MSVTAPDIAALQRALEARRLSGWLFYDFRGLDPIALRILKFPPEKMGTRRWFYYVPASGSPVKVCHRIEADALEHLPGSLVLFSGWKELGERLAAALAGAREVAMQYSPGNAIPYVSRVDAGTLEMVTACGVKVVSSAD